MIITFRHHSLIVSLPSVAALGESALFTVSSNISDYEGARIEVVDFKTGVRKVLQQGGYYGRYLPSGYLLCVR